MTSSRRKRTAIAGALLLGVTCALLWWCSPAAPSRAGQAVVRPKIELRATRTPALVVEPTPRQARPERVVQALPLTDGDVEAAALDAEALVEAEPEVERFRGKVIDIETGWVIADAEIRVDGHPVARSNDNGCFEFESPEGAPVIAISADGYAYQMCFLLNVPFLQRRTECGYLFELVPGAVVNGTVSDNHGEPITHGSVFAFDKLGFNYVHGQRTDRDAPRGNNLYLRDRWSGTLSTGAELGWVFVQRSTAELDEAGHFSLRDVAAGEPMHLLVWAENVLREFEVPIVLEPGQVAEVELTVERAAIVRGSVTLPPGAQRAGVRFCFHEKKHWPYFVARKRDRWVPIQADGSYTSGPLWPCDEMHVEVSCLLHHASGRWERVVRESIISLEAEAVIELDLDLTGRN